MPKRRKQFEEYARSRGFNPLIPDNWYSINWNKIRGFTLFPVYIAFYGIQANLSQIADIIAVYYKGSPTVALLDVFPDIGLQENKFVKPVSSMKYN